MDELERLRRIEARYKWLVRMHSVQLIRLINVAFKDRADILSRIDSRIDTWILVEKQENYYDDSVVGQRFACKGECGCEACRKSYSDQLD